MTPCLRVFAECLSANKKEIDVHLERRLLTTFIFLRSLQEDSTGFMRYVFGVTKGRAKVCSLEFRREDFERVYFLKRRCCPVNVCTQGKPPREQKHPRSTSRFLGFASVTGSQVLKTKQTLMNSNISYENSPVQRLAISLLF